MSTAYLRRLINGEMPTIDEWNDHLIAFHTQYESATTGSMSLMHTAGGETSYHLLARRTQELAADASAILDIGCGAGLLLQRLMGAYGRPLELVGIDLCQAEIDRGRATLENATFVCGDARNADLGAARFDAIVMHLAIMIAAQPQAILSRAKAALREGGVLLMLMEALPLHPVIAGILGAAMMALHAVHEKFAMVVPERRDLADDAELQSVLTDAGFAGIEIEEHVVSGRFTRAEAWAYVQRIYPFGLLDASDRERVREAIESALNRLLEDDGRVEITFPLRLAIARA